MALSNAIRRRLSTGLNAAIVTVASVAALVVVTLLAAQQQARFDLSEEGRATLSPQLASAILRAGDRQVSVEVIGFSHPNQGEDSWFRDRTIRDVLAEVDEASPWVSTRFVDLDAERLASETLGVKRYGTLVVRTKDDRVDIADRDLFKRRAKERSVFIGEAQLVSALTKVLSDQRRRLYALTGHGERAVFKQGQGELVSFTTLVNEIGYELVPLSLLEGGLPTVPPDASAVLVMRPRVPLTPTEDDALGEYLRGGGRMAVFSDPGLSLPLSVQRLGVSLGDGRVLDEDYRFPDIDRPHLRYGRHPITADLQGETSMVLDVVRVAPVDASGTSWASDVLLSTGRRGWVERDAELEPEYTPGRDGAGPVAAAIALQGPDGARLVVVGDSEMLTDPFVDTGPANATFLANTLRWLVGADEQLSVVRATRASRPLVMSTVQRQRARWLLSGAWPLLIVLVGLVRVWRRGRR
jgi:hypothetical protein